MLYVQALVHNKLGDYHKRDAVALRHKDARAEHERLESIYVNDGWYEIWDLVSEISAKLASRR